MQTTSQETQALTAAEFIALDQRTRFIFLICFLDAARNADILNKHWLKLLSRSTKASPFKDAVFEGYIALSQEADRCARKLTERGQLLFAFQGTTVLQGCAA